MSVPHLKSAVAAGVRFLDVVLAVPPLLDYVVGVGVVVAVKGPAGGVRGRGGQSSVGKWPKGALRSIPSR